MLRRLGDLHNIRQEEGYFGLAGRTILRIIPASPEQHLDSLFLAGIIRNMVRRVSEPSAYRVGK